jgi:catechol 2,3-dioxygenase-like lactoylglutathione lyase family enzyme
MLSYTACGDWPKGKKVIRGIKFVNVPVTNQDEAVKFYTEKLGFRVLTDQPFDEKQRWIELGIPGGDSKLVLFTVNGDAARIGSHQPVTFWSDDVQATSQVLKSKGVVFAMDPKTEEWGTAAIFKDQDGNQFVLSSK